MLWPVVRTALFALDSERAHNLALAVAKYAPGPLAALSGCAVPPPRLGKNVAGIRFAGPIGLAAGADKNGVAIPFWAKSGFGFIEIGTVTPNRQEGNERPRQFRLPNDGALINRMGFNNHGLRTLAMNLTLLRVQKQWPQSIPVGANIGKGKDTPLSNAKGDYVVCVHWLQGLVDWFTVNVSSPNTPGLRDLQSEEYLNEIIPAVVEAADGTPVFVKFALDCTDEQLAAATAAAINSGVSGIVAFNTTTQRHMLSQRQGIVAARASSETGGLSGRPLWPMLKDKINVVLDVARPGNIPVIAVGGIDNVEQVEMLLYMGCAATALYTGMVYGGPGLPTRLNNQLVARLNMGPPREP